MGVPPNSASSDVGITGAHISRYEITESDDGGSRRGQCVQYVIHVKRGQRSYDVRKRFSEFCTLHSSLVAASPSAHTLTLPRKTFVRCFQDEHLTERMAALNDFLADFCKRWELHNLMEVRRFFEPQLPPEWGVSVEPAKPGFFGALLDISKGGKRSKETFMTVVELTNEHKKFKEEISEMMEQQVTDEEMNAKSSTYLKSMAERIRDLMLKNGGFQVKLGQAISAQKALLPREITDTLAACCDKARCLPLSAIQAQVTSILGCPLDTVFSWVSEEPLAAASIAQVHRARLQQTDEEVILKVVHPGVGESMKADYAFMPYLIKLVERVEPNHGLHPLAVTMESMIKQELDMRREGQNRERLAAVVDRSARSARSHHADVVFPRVHWEHCREGLMVQEYMVGATALTSQHDVDANGVPFRLAVAELAELFGETAFIHGYLHNDLHPGNVLVRPKPNTSLLSPWMRNWVVHGSLLAMCVAALVPLSLAVRCLLSVFWPWLTWLCLLCCMLVGGLVVLYASGGEGAHLVGCFLGLLLGLAMDLAGRFCWLRGAAERLLARAAGDRFELIIIDHGFHTNLPYEFRRTWCKVWAAVGLGDEDLLQEAARELNLDGDEYRVLPMILCLLPYPVWKKHEFPSPGKLLELIKDESFGLPRCAAMDKKMPHLWHLVMRVNGQVSALFQMQYGITPTCRYEFMRFMTRSALMGLRFTERPLGTLPVPGCLTTADRAFFEREFPRVEEEMSPLFRWSQSTIEEMWHPNTNFLKAVKEKISSEAAGEGAAGAKQ